MRVVELNPLLAGAQPGEWIYASSELDGLNHRDTLKVTNGYLDKFYLCVVDLLTGLRASRKTQEVIDCILREDAGSIQMDRPDCLFVNASRVSQLDECLSGLSKVRLVWHKAIVLREINEWLPPFSFTLLQTHFEQAKAFIRVVQKATYTDLFHRFAAAYKALLPSVQEETPALKRERFRKGLESVNALLTLKKSLLGQGPSGTSDEYRLRWLEEKWTHSIGFWKIAPCTQQLETAGGYYKTLEFLEITVDYERSPQSSVAHSITELLNFFQRQSPSDRRPVSIMFTEMWHLDSQDKIFYHQLMNGLLELMAARPEFFIHQATLYQEAKLYTKQNPRTNVKNNLLLYEACLSRLAGKGVEQQLNHYSYFPARTLRPDIEALLQRLNRPIPRLQRNLQDVEIQARLRSLEEGQNFVCSFQGTDLGCHKEVLLAAFPVLAARQGPGWTKEDVPDRLDLEKWYKPDAPLSSSCAQWVLQALLDYAYMRELPNLPNVYSKATFEAYQVYLRYIDCLNPGTMEVEDLELDASLENAPDRC